MSEHTKTLAEKSDRSSVRALLRGLEILEYINEFQDTRPSAIARHLNMPRATVCRILDTLEGSGYILRCGSSGKPLISARTAKLSEIYTSKTRLLQSGEALLRQAHPAILWPVDLLRRSGTELVVIETTHGLSPHSTEEKLLGRRLPFFGTAAGHCYLAHCPPEERHEILQTLGLGLAREEQQDLAAKMRLVLSSGAQDHGYAWQVLGDEKSRNAAIALPILSGGKLIACLSMTWAKRALKPQTIVDTYMETLQKLANSIAASL